ncbi:ribosome-binding protein 1 [Plakobranchus ocellatus]|uniref:Ribosome-binding protein 1 n=1 Tax=Plakobranchus ocellatus TaxID=259542 RepID=A0AAV3YXL3_9GAST|nr:ribosome-binding protein 1 [Plakobranchus ocellatus]
MMTATVVSQQICLLLSAFFGQEVLVANALKDSIISNKKSSLLSMLFSGNFDTDSALDNVINIPSLDPTKRDEIYNAVYGEGISNIGDYRSRKPYNGDYGTGMPNSGDYGTGMPYSGDYGSGMPYSDEYESRMPYSGVYGSGMPYSGDYGLEYPYRGDYGSGSPNSDDYGSGMPYSGDYGSEMTYSGDYGSGMPHSGDFGSETPYSGIILPFPTWLFDFKNLVWG